MMSREERAKQFAPFESLNGLRQALKKKEEEHERVERAEVSEERAAHLSAMIARLHRGARARITYYSCGTYVDVEGRVEEVDLNVKYIKIGDGKIFFDDLYEIKVEE